MFDIGDKIRIISDNTLWNQKSGIILDNQNNGYKVKVDFNSEKSITEYFDENELLYDLITEASKQKPKSPELLFIDKYIGQKVMFKGFDYEEIYAKEKSAEGIDFWKAEDLDDIEELQSIERKEGVITSNALNDSYSDLSSDESNFESAYWNVTFNDKAYMLCGKDLYIMNTRSINEDLVETEDFLADYLKYVDIDGNELPAWIFAEQIATAEGLDSGFVLEIAKKYKYPCYCVYNGPKASVIIADKSIKAEEIQSQYVDYLSGNAVLEKL